MSSSEGLEVVDLAVAWNGVRVLDGVTFSLRPGELVTLMGPNGSGKTTLLRAIAGFEPVAAGRVSLEGRDLARVPPHARGVGLLFQEPVLLPRRTVAENLAFGPEVQRLDATLVAARVAEAAERLHLGDLLDRPSEALSGGERQRVALARTLAARPRLVLLDEPFAAVDPELRAELRSEFRRILLREGVSVLHVTHDREEGLFLGDRVLLLDRGRLVQAGRPREVFENPATAGVARFLGYNVAREGDRLVAVHPTEVELLAPEGAEVEATVVASGPVGDGWAAFLEARDGARWEVRGRSGPPPVEGARVGLRGRRRVLLPR